VDELGGEGDAHDVEFLQTAVHHRLHSAPGTEAMGLGEGLVHEHLFAALGGGEAALAEVDGVERRILRVREGDQGSDDRLVETLHADLHPGEDPRPDGLHVRQLRDSVRDRERRADEGGEEVAEAVVRVELRAGAVQGIPNARQRHEGADATRDHEDDGQDLGAEIPELTEELSVERPHQWISSGVRRLEFSFTLSIRPSAMVTTRWAKRAMAALCVITAVVAPSSSLSRSRASRTTFPVRMSRAPVGSSQRRMSGFFTIARA